MPERRAFLRRALLLAAAGFFAPVLARAQAVSRFSAYPFTLGIASGSPTTTGFVLWTRLAPAPLAGGGMGAESVEVRWEVAHDEKFSRIAKQGMATAVAERAHTLHVEADGLEPGRGYFYRFIAGGEASAIGRARTAPAPEAPDATLRIALASCQHWEQGYFAAYRHIVDEAPDLVAFVGDYIYERSRRGDVVRRHHNEEPKTLAGYRDRYAQYKSDKDLQAAHASAPWLMTWDDHEVANDYANAQSQDLDAGFLARRAAAYRAYFEHQPIRPSVLRSGGEYRIYGSHAWGNLANFLVLDDRQYRDPQACPRTGRGGSNVVGPACTQRLQEGRTLLGKAQEQWLDRELMASKARWTLIVQQTLLAPATRHTKKGPQTWTDGWDGYPHARARLLASLVKSGAANPVILGGDVHAHYVADIHADPAKADSPVIASEFCGSSITSQGPDAKLVAGIRDSNPHIRHADGSKRGYILFDINRDRLQAKLRVLDTVKRPDASVSTDATFTVRAGKPGVAAPS